MKRKVPALAGVPERVPVEVLSVSPAGRSPLTWDQVMDSSESVAKA